ncbi:3-hydroxybutyryl-CoA dehydrogenase [Anseongella ginsenosidimutans]|uniref:3-hydroxybutyryl-CoA dehydrogenase n=1 Tax=Anseongella ginsenosidimutans TaxID=496056 RepID=A0A4R3KS57_9SPHI|nr:3-hydroxyacyl-CoA dehydrogenase NAD-binding domain-containing protein [Anseongella ginsenosidimutans]QEC52949.1 3-hydroxybutyryl-CoA dehydrogenase [Anseongella ginsenosidimutans]TCS87347.1 3-hydroxybutyryl-CoA dehydrogenase [Anseongella ginsenosidimutans]
MKKITIIGSGTMGNGIAHVFALHGYPVSLVDVSAGALEKAMQTIAGNLDRMIKKELITPEKKERALSAIRTFTTIDRATEDAGLVVEAVSEDPELKLSLFRQLDDLCPPDTILASNTSSISISRIAAATKRPEKVVGMHFMNPVPVMKLVEVIKGYATSGETCAAVMELAQNLEKIPVAVNDYPGFVANRILMPMINEAIYAVHEGVAGVKEIDTVMKLGMSHPMGPLQLADFIGLDVCLSILRVLFDGFGNPKYAPCPLLVNMVTAGVLGVKSGAGFYSYENGTKDAPVAGRFRN